ncbi:MAG: PhzF family phenazine biosynthesis protein [Ignavibacteriaceae bacterium]|nr:PhzF family phenazine biosynthesis protein [Ignavibacteriaceae bacterium]
MKKKLEIFQIDAFTNLPFKGNPAAVTFGNGLSTIQKQLIAREMNLSETAFLSKSKIADYKLQWFTPTSEVKICGHATIASLHFLTEKKLLREGQQIKFETLSGVLNCHRVSNHYFMQIPIPKISIYKKSQDALLKVLGIKKTQLNKNLPFIIVNQDTCYVNVRSLDDLKNLKPNFNELLELGKQKKEFGIIVVFTLETFDKNTNAHSRCFAPYYGINEDPVTGSTNGPLLLVLKTLGFIKQQEAIIQAAFEQGDFIGKDGRVRVTFNPVKNELYISGNAVTVLKANLVF